MGLRKRGLSGISSNNWLDTSDDGECDSGSQHHKDGMSTGIATLYAICCFLPHNVQKVQKQAA